jgi:archaellum component FlaC
LSEITEDYRTQIERSNSYLEGQNKVINSLLELLKNYESELADVEISFDQQSLGSLNSQLSKLHSRLDALEKQDRNLVEQLNGVLREL